MLVWISRKILGVDLKILKETIDSFIKSLLLFPNSLINFTYENSLCFASGYLASVICGLEPPIKTRLVKNFFFPNFMPAVSQYRAAIAAKNKNIPAVILARLAFIDKSAFLFSPVSCCNSVTKSVYI